MSSGIEAQGKDTKATIASTEAYDVMTVTRGSTFYLSFTLESRRLFETTIRKTIDSID